MNRQRWRNHQKPRGEACPRQTKQRCKYLTGSVPQVKAGRKSSVHALTQHQYRNTGETKELTGSKEILALCHECTFLQALTLEQTLAGLDHALSAELHRRRRCDRGLCEKSRLLGRLPEGRLCFELQDTTRKHSMPVPLHANTGRGINERADGPPADVATAEHLQQYNVSDAQRGRRQGTHRDHGVVLLDWAVGAHLAHNRQRPELLAWHVPSILSVRRVEAKYRL